MGLCIGRSQPESIEPVLVIALGYLLSKERASSAARASGSIYYKSKLSVITTSNFPMPKMGPIRIKREALILMCVQCACRDRVCVINVIYRLVPHAEGFIQSEPSRRCRLAVSVA